VMRACLTLLALLVLYTHTALAEPPLPDGLQRETKKETKKEGPKLPSGLVPAQEPSLPTGIGEQPKKMEPNNVPENWADQLGIGFRGFSEIRAGLRLQRDRHEKQASIGESRLQLSFEKQMPFATATVTTDLLFDPVLDSHKIDLESGNGWLDLREAHLLFRPTDFSDLKIGRQVLTWGTGDLLFINDLFPKDWNAFFIGRDEEYLKAPSDALKLALFSDIANLDIIYTPRFDSDRFIDGKRLSYFNPAFGDTVGRANIVTTDQPDGWFSDDEIALRLYRNIGAAEVALYLYDGFWKSPAGQDAVTGLATFPRLRTYGASLRRPLFGGIANIELGYYDSRDDRTGSNPLIPNSELRLLVGFEKELASELTGSVQFYQERLADYTAYITNLPQGMFTRDKVRSVLTARLTKLAMNQNLIWSFFLYYSPSDQDGYLRPKVSYKMTDNWTTEMGANIFFGAENYTFFGQFKDNSNMFFSLRRSF